MPDLLFVQPQQKARQHPGTRAGGWWWAQHGGALCRRSVSAASQRR
jgi:hypothetical protein